VVRSKNKTELIIAKQEVMKSDKKLLNDRVSLKEKIDQINRDIICVKR
jgi:hypothetical protein